MFEPLQKILSTQGERLERKFDSIETVLRGIAHNTRAATALNTWAVYTVRGDGGRSATLQNDTAYGWRVHWASMPGGTGSEVGVYFAAVNPAGFLLRLEPGTTLGSSRKVDWYIPAGASLIVNNEESENAPGTVVFQVELLRSTSAQADTGTNQEHLNVYEVKQQPDASVLTPDPEEGP